MEKTKVQFLIEDNSEVLAYFPDIEELAGHTACYSHNGQHSICTLVYVTSLPFATADEFMPLYKDLTTGPARYDLEVTHKVQPHNPTHRLVGQVFNAVNNGWIDSKSDRVELVYGIPNGDTREMLEVYFYKKGEDHFHRSTCYAWDAIPRKYRNQAAMLKAYAGRVRPGHKLTIL